MRKVSYIIFQLIAVWLIHLPAFSQKKNEFSEKERLVKEICPDLHKEAGRLFANKLIPIREIDSISYTAIYDYSEKKQVQIAKYMLTPQYIIMLVDIYPSFSDSYEGVSVLALFDKKTQKILDVQNVKYDKFTYIYSLKSQSLFEVGEKSYVLLIHNHHFGGGLGYNQYSLFVISPQIKELETLFTINYSCFTPKPLSITTRPSKKKFYDVDLSFQIDYGEGNCTETNELKSRFSSTLRGKYKWDDKKNKYINSREDFKRLGDWSESNL